MGSFSASLGNHLFELFLLFYSHHFHLKILDSVIFPQLNIYSILGLYNSEVLVFTIGGLRLFFNSKSAGEQICLFAWIKRPSLVNLLVVTKKKAGANMAT